MNAIKRFDKAAVVKRMKEEIFNEVMVHHSTPPSVGSFSELHDYVDANEYGGFCEGGYDVSDQATLDFVNACQDEVDAWLKAGGLRDAIGGRH